MYIYRSVISGSESFKLIKGIVLGLLLPCVLNIIITYEAYFSHFHT